MFAIEWNISPNNPLIHHFVNILFYLLTIQILYIFLQRILRNYSPILTLSIALLFAAHPTHTEVVANIKSRDELMAFFFSILALYYSLIYLDSKKIKSLWISCLCFSLALLSKETAILLVVILPATFYFFSEESWKTYFKPVICFGIITLLFLMLRYYVLANNGSSYEIAILENPLIHLSFMERFPTSISMLGNYLFLLFVPNKLLYDYSFNQIPIVSYTNTNFILSLLLILFLIIYSLYTFKKKNIIAFGIIFFILTIALFSNIPLKIGSIFSIRFLYFPSLGFCIALPLLLNGIIARKYTSSKNTIKNSFAGPQKTLVIILIAITSLFTLKTIRRNSDWKDNFSLFSADSEALTNNAKAHLFLGTEYIKKGEAVTINSTRKTALIKRGIHELTWSNRIYSKSLETLENLGNAHQILHQNDSAVYYYKCAQKIDITSSNGNLGDIYFDLKEFKNAIRFYKKEIFFHPKSIRGYNNLGMTLATIGDYDNALYYLLKAIKTDPSNRDLKLLVANVYKAKGDEENFMKYYSLANQIMH
jgi:tetratricopeptide (TPR) repeat protein